MTINIQVPKKHNFKPKIAVFGVGGGGCNAVNNMISANLAGIEFIVANTDAQSLENSQTENRIQLGENTTQGLGAGSYPEVGKSSAEEAESQIKNYLDGCNMVFVTAGMGGGTGTGASPVIARLAKEMDILTVAVVTKPFQFEGSHRMQIAELGLQELQKFVDTLIVIPNQNLFRIADKNTTFADAFKIADEVLHNGVRSVTDLMVVPGLINLDFADVKAVISEMGKAMMGAGEAEGENRAIAAAEAAISNPLLDNSSMQGARGVLINITGGMDMTLFEVDEAANRVREEVDSDANIIFGSAFNKDFDGKIRVSVVATGIEVTGSASNYREARRMQTGNAASYKSSETESIKSASAHSSAGKSTFKDYKNKDYQNTVATEPEYLDDSSLESGTIYDGDSESVDMEDNFVLPESVEPEFSDDNVSYSALGGEESYESVDDDDDDGEEYNNEGEEHNEDDVLEKADSQENLVSHTANIQENHDEHGIQQDKEKSNERQKQGLISRNFSLFNLSSWRSSKSSDVTGDTASDNASNDTDNGRDNGKNSASSNTKEMAGAGGSGSGRMAHRNNAHVPQTPLPDADIQNSSSAANISSDLELEERPKAEVSEVKEKQASFNQDSFDIPAFLRRKSG